MFLLLLLAFFPVLSSVSSLRVMPDDKKVKYVEVGDDLSLACDYTLEGDTLYSIKWYRDNDEFFRYQQDKNSTSIYPLDGLNVDDYSSKTHILVKNVSLATSGNFKCEISGGGPRFPTAVLNSKVVVVDLPKTRPTISGVQARYYLGDEVIATCWSGYSYPSPQFKWWINDSAADPAVVRVLADGSAAQLRFKIKENHLFGDSLRLKCTVEILNIYWMSSEEEAKILQSPGFSLPAFSKPMFSSDSRNLSSKVSSILISLRLVSILLNL
ncbi:uncharacterized protein LOC111710153 [Eurytemora carolleeae]|uniref:uncharacterized protein LOC111710153 n=1 Tax=Eurytemora carolleeae TaxID=1294199 RepID=UPI000C759D0A|nr:uncharacterized protein LOC111710153 [Eurytemora carolleeae]|eukprot:XP_023339970.1 uncharacterized protein LOC111710153 [Eurytemora affinis]